MEYHVYMEKKIEFEVVVEVDEAEVRAYLLDDGYTQNQITEDLIDDVGIDLAEEKALDSKHPEMCFKCACKFDSMASPEIAEIERI